MSLVSSVLRRSREALLAVAVASLAACKDPPKPEPAPAEPKPRATVHVPVGESPFAVPEKPSVDVPPTRVNVQHILFAFRGARRGKRGVTRTRAEAKKLAEDVRKSLVGEDSDAFTAAVKRYSDDPAAIERLGTTGFVDRAGLEKSFADAAFALKVGEMSQVVETPFGFHVIRRLQ